MTLMYFYCKRDRSGEFLSTVVWEFQTTRHLRTIYFLDMAYGTRKILLDHIIGISEEPAQLSPAVMFFEGLFLNQFKNCTLDF